MAAMNDANVDAIVLSVLLVPLPHHFLKMQVALAPQYIDFTGVLTTFRDEESVFTSVTVPFDEALSTSWKTFYEPRNLSPKTSQCATPIG